MDLMAQYPGLADLRRRAKKRLPLFVWEFLDSGTGAEKTRNRNRTALDARLLMPSILHGEFAPDLSVDLFGQTLPLPFGIAPVGMSGLIWPDAERHLARAAASADIPYTLSTVASQTPEDVAPAMGQHGWFQMYPPRDPDIRTDMLNRARAAGFKVLVLTVDVPVASRRERQVRSGLTTPPKLTPRLLAQVACRPAWALGMAQQGMPRMRMIDSYAGDLKGLPSTSHAGYMLRTSPDWDYLRWLRDAWDGPMVVKGVMRAEDAKTLEDEGMDAIWISNHAGRQFDAAPATIDVVEDIRAATKLPVIVDGGIEGGLDMLRAIALGADFVMMGRAWHYALAALGAQGPGHLTAILKADLESNMGQLGARRLADVRSRLCQPG
ncbi:MULTISPECIES: alpha-hydroxy acid oxidase [unclassified Roseovarius]|uniref:alpha-hydroxy acid oxidase n=1 Tax=unclassified Roseovarius TaxID=2614913 RepID=UPI00273F4AE7|nr:MULTISPECIES: alpha-hydroxy acid oxidase [unclassified Roseovarius]